MRSYHAEINAQDVSPAFLALLADQVADGGEPEDVISTTRGTLASLLRSAACREHLGDVNAVDSSDA